MTNETKRQILNGLAEACELGVAALVGAYFMKRHISKVLISRNKDISNAVDRVLRRAIEENLTQGEIEEMLFEQFQFLGMMWTNNFRNN